MSLPYRQVLDFLRKTFPSARLEVEEFSNGSAMIDVHVGSRLVVVEYLPRLGFGVSEPADDDSGFGGHDQAFETPRDVNEYLTELLENEIRT